MSSALRTKADPVGGLGAEKAANENAGHSVESRRVRALTVVNDNSAETSTASAPDEIILDLARLAADLYFDGILITVEPTR